MKIGKLTNETLKKLILDKLPSAKDVMLTSGVGEDCAAIEFGSEACVLSTDPITGATEAVGSLAVHVSGNDVASSGAKPKYMLATLLIPPDKTEEDIAKVVDELIKTSEQLGISIIGGHTEITSAVNRIVVSTTVIGRVQKEKLISSSGAQLGDAIVMTKYAGVEGTCIMYGEYPDVLRSVLSDTDKQEAEKLRSYLSVIKEGMIASEVGVTAMHDITEGGVYGAVHELCIASDVGCELYSDEIPILESTKKMCSRFGINPKRLIGSGSMLITTSNTDKLLSTLKESGINGAVIGKVTEGDITVTEDGVNRILEPPEADELFSIKL